MLWADIALLQHPTSISYLDQTRHPIQSCQNNYLGKER